MVEACKPPRVFSCRGCQMKHLKNGGRIDLIRQNQHLTISAYAAKCGVPEKTMERILLGSNEPNGTTLLKIIKRGGVSPDILEIDGWEEYE